MAKRAKPNPPIWTRPAPGTRRPKLTREQIAEAALAIADAEGFAEVSMRRIAAELEVGTMTLYYYVKTKDDLVVLMDDAIMAEVVLPPGALPAGWRAGITAIARNSARVFARHPWALYALQGARIGPNGMRHMEQSLQALRDAPVDLKGKLRLLSIVDDYVFGHVLRISEAWTHPMDARVMMSITEFFAAQLATGEYPELSQMIGDDDVFAVFSKLARWMGEDERFEAGLAALLDGLEAHMKQTGTLAARAGRSAHPARPRDSRHGHEGRPGREAPPGRDDREGPPEGHAGREGPRRPGRPGGEATRAARRSRR